MKKAEIMNKVSGAVGKIGFQMKKHSPEILMVTGIVGAVAGAVMACRATLKVEEVMDTAKDKMDTIHEAEEKGCTAMGKDYSEEDAKKDTAIVYVQTGLSLAKLYAPSVALGVLSVTSILASNNILRKRNVAIAAAYATAEKGFKEYRNRVIEKFGEEVDKELKYGLKAETKTETVIDDETGEKKKVKTTSYTVDPDKISGYARMFEKYTTDEDGNTVLNRHWDNRNEYNVMFLRAQENYANDLLKAKKMLFLNDVYEMLGLPRTKAGQVVGWVYDTENPVGDNYVSFGPFENSLTYSDTNPAILLDFNVDGNVWELMS